MQLLADLGRLRHGLDRLGPQVLGVRAGEADAPDAVHRADGAQQLGEERPPLRDVAAVGVHVLPEQRHLGHPAPGEQLHLRHDVVEGPAHLGTPHRRDDAEGAGVVAAGLDVRPTPRTEARGRRRDRAAGCSPRLGRRGVEDLHDGALGLRPAQETGRTGQVVGAEDDVDPAHLLLNALAVLLGQAPADGDLQTRLGVDQLLQAPQRPVEPLVGVLPDAAGVEHDHVGVLHGGGRRQAVGHQQPGEPLGVVLVHLAPEGTDEIGPGHPRKSTEQGAPRFPAVERQVTQGFRRTRWPWVLVPLALVLAGCSSGGGGSGGSTSETTTPQQPTPRSRAPSTSVQSAMATYLHDDERVRQAVEPSRLPRGRRPHAREQDPRLRQRARRPPPLHARRRRTSPRPSTRPRRWPTAWRSSATPSRHRPTTTRCSTPSTSTRPSPSCRGTSPRWDGSLGT